MLNTKVSLAAFIETMGFVNSRASDKGPPNYSTFHLEFLTSKIVLLRGSEEGKNIASVMTGLRQICDVIGLIKTKQHSITAL